MPDAVSAFLAGIGLGLLEDTFAEHDIDGVTLCVEIKLRTPHAIDATLSPCPRRLDGVEVHDGPRNISQDNLTLWLISTQALVQ